MAEIGNTWSYFLHFQNFQAPYPIQANKHQSGRLSRDRSQKYPYDKKICLTDSQTTKS